MISVITPVYNEAERIAESVCALREALSEGFPDEPWELVIVNDGSTDDSLPKIQEAEKEDDRITVVSYETNRGRGYALRQGFAKAKGGILVTIESDLTWGKDIAKRMVDALRDNPEAAFVIASPHLEGGGYENVPGLRVSLSRYGNKLLRRVFDARVTMATGMARCYKREVIDSMVLSCNDKEIHLEILSKALALGYIPVEIPAVLRWPEGRKSSTFGAGLIRLIFTHLLFGIAERPRFFLGGVGIALFVIGGVLGLVDVYWMLFATNPAASKPPVNPSFIAVCISVGLLVLVFDLLANQNRAIQKELTIMQRQMRKLHKQDEPAKGKE